MTDDAYEMGGGLVLSFGVQGWKCARCTFSHEGAVLAALEECSICQAPRDSSRTCTANDEVVAADETSPAEETLLAEEVSPAEETLLAEDALFAG